MAKKISKPTGAGKRSPARKRNGLNITKPVSVWNKPLKLDIKKLFVSITKATCDGLIGKWESLGIDLAEAASSLGLKPEPGQVAWILIQNALSQAIYQLIQENANELVPLSEKKINSFCKSLDLNFEEKDLTIDENFFIRPAELPILQDIKKPFMQWLEGHKICPEPHKAQARAQSIADRLPSYFVNKLHKEWSRRPKFYEPVLETIRTPFTRANARERSWLNYNALLNRQVDESVFDETFGLRQVYVPLRAYFIKRPREEKEKVLNRESIRGEIHLKSEPRKTVVDLESILIDWLKKEDLNDAVRLISGGPGCGKSCFAKMFAAHLVESHTVSILYIPLHQFNHTDDLADSVGRYVKHIDAFDYNPMDYLDSGDNRLFIIFDGLDELAMQGKVGAESARLFAEEVDRTIRRFNSQRLRLQILISGRDLAIQSTENEFRSEGQILYILPYYLSGGQRELYIDSKKLLAVDQRDLWWELYGKAVGLPNRAMPEELRRDELQDITDQPLLNYLMALSYVRGAIDFTTEINLNAIYHDLLSAVFARGYESRGTHKGTHVAIRQMDLTNFITILQEIALATWHGDGRTTTVKEIQKHCETSGLTCLLDVFQEGADKGVTRLLTAFYFRQYGMHPEGERTFEFTHKSFGEYLTALRIVRGMKDISEELEKQSAGDYRAWNEDQCLTRWVELCGPSEMDEYLHAFLCREIEIVGGEVAVKLQNSFSRLIGYMLKEGMPMQKLDPRPKYMEEVRLARNAEEALLAALNAYAKVTQQVSKINWPAITKAGDWIRRLQGQRMGPENRLTLNCLSWLDMSNCIFHLLDLYRATMNKSLLLRSQFRFANLFGADLREADLREADLGTAGLGGANLEKANLEGANLGGADLEGANLEGANLEKANLAGANLEGANLEKANLAWANLEKANLAWANLEKANLKGANLEKANLKGVKLAGAKNVGTELAKMLTRKK